MTRQEDGNNAYRGLRATNKKLSLLRLSALATQKIFPFPVATATGELLTWVAASLIELIPLTAFWALFLRLFVSVAVVFLILVGLVWLSSLPSQSRPDRSPGRRRSARDIVAASPMVGLLISVPTVATVWLLPPNIDASLRGQRHDQSRTSKDRRLTARFL